MLNQASSILYSFVATFTSSGSFVPGLLLEAVEFINWNIN